MLEFFTGLNLDRSLAEALQKQQITVLTDIQTKVIPEMLKNKDLIVQSETGTGKTLAYLLPLFGKIDAAKNEMQAIILVPTHELAIQVMRQIEFLSENSQIKARAALMIGNVNIERQIDKLKEKPQIIVGSPGRVLELIGRKKITAYTVKTIIIDEGDRLLDKNNADTVKQIVKSTLRERQLLLFSATITKDAEARAKEIMKDPEVIKSTVTAAVPESIEHLYFLAEQRDKVEVLRKVIGIMKPQKAMIFTGGREDTDFCVNRLRYHGVTATGIQGHTEKLDRKKAIGDFKSGKTPFLVCSDVVARGMDIEGVTHIFNIHIPERSGDYLHRAGRTGRKGNAGTAVSIVTERELQFIELFEKELNITIQARDMYKGKIINKKR